MNSFDPNYFLHAANVLLLVAYSVRDVLWLRLFAVASALIAIPYFALQPAPLWVPIAWSSVFAAINLFQSWRLFVERRPVKLTPEEEQVRRLAFEDLPSRKVLQVLSVGSWINVETGERIIERGKCPEAISLIVRGTVCSGRGRDIAVAVPPPEPRTGACWRIRFLSQMTSREASHQGRDGAFAVEEAIADPMRGCASR